ASNPLPGITITPTGPTTALVQWTPTQVGIYDVGVLADNGSLLGFDSVVATQDYELSVVTADAVPAITSAPPTPATLGNLYQYQVAARDTTPLASLLYSLQ